ncbi:MAG: hypothetical protein ABIT16_11745 [Croceibacterium sp.]
MLVGLAAMGAFDHSAGAVLCAAAMPGWPVHSMATMYLVMALVHLPPWIEATGKWRQNA